MTTLNGRETSTRMTYVRTLKRTLMVIAATLIGASSAAAQTIVEYYHVDAIGSVRAVTNTAGQVVERHDYLPFGEEWNPPTITTGTPKRFTGKERDEETNLDYFGARYYSAKTARFTTVDPVYMWQEDLADPQRWN